MRYKQAAFLWIKLLLMKKKLPYGVEKMYNKYLIQHFYSIDTHILRCEFDKCNR